MSKSGDAQLDELMQVLGHGFSDLDLLRTALTHPSALTRRNGKSGPRQKGGQDNQRLEFLGDRVLGLVVAEMLYRTFGKEDEGAMAKRLAALVRQEGLAHVARTIDLGRHLILSRGEADGGGRDNAATLADACEAIIGAIYLDAGLDAARKFVERHWAALLAADEAPPQDAKTALQEWAQAAGLPLPVYQVVESSGPPHDPTFTVEVRVSGKRTAQASGKSKRQAEQAAAASLMSELRS
jgi:ribonuclease III